MAMVVNMNDVSKALGELDWNVSRQELAEALRENNVSAVHFLAYLRAATSARGSFDDSGINGCPAATATKITDALTKKGVVIV